MPSRADFILRVWLLVVVVKQQKQFCLSVFFLELLTHKCVFLVIFSVLKSETFEMTLSVAYLGGTCFIRSDCVGIYKFSTRLIILRVIQTLRGKERLIKWARWLFLERQVVKHILIFIFLFSIQHYLHGSQISFENN